MYQEDQLNILRTLTKGGFYKGWRGLDSYCVKTFKNNPSRMVLARSILQIFPGYSNNPNSGMVRGQFTMSFSDMKELLPFLQPNDLKRVVKKLKEDGLITTQKRLNSNEITVVYYDALEKLSPNDLPREILKSSKKMQVNQPVPKSDPTKAKKRSNQMQVKVSVSSNLQKFSAKKRTNQCQNVNQPVPKSDPTYNKKNRKKTEETRRKGGNPLNPPQPGETSATESEEDMNDIRTMISPTKANLSSIKVKLHGNKPKPRKKAGADAFGWTPSQEKGMLSPKIFNQRYKRAILNHKPSAKFIKLEAPGRANEVACQIIDAVVEDTRIDKSEKKTLEAILTEWFDWYATNRTGQKRVREADLRLIRLFESWEDYKKIMDSPEIILSRQSRNIPKSPVSIVKSLELVFNSGMKDEGKLRASLLRHGIIITANYMKVKEEVDDPENVIRLMLEENAKTDSGKNLNRQFYAKTHLHICSVVEKKMVLLSDWENIYKNVWMKAFPLNIPDPDEQVQKLCKEFFKELSSGM